MTNNSCKRLKYTLGVIHCPETNQILLLNRQKKPWMGRWNGVGGKLDHNETPHQCIVRETEEETGLSLPQYKSRGVVLWTVDNEDNLVGEAVGGMYIFTAEVTPEQVANYPTPIIFDKEGILDWKNLDWVLSKDNMGIVDNMTVILRDLFDAKETDIFNTVYRQGRLMSCEYLPGKNTDYLN
ncbi:uncharacterized protein CANTADRAFT_47164 [Suhomyces tanzawaensis NRRL Y-17324]|uniref:Nudix hydrolase domain-containing protein n=1 Tax=Suhomyces tanzawaensis NRRL Y-17324 TaxID=984487 RepID=A0A1E4SMU7_9ASCO|nr:uncharacterized protein CANTADRAFT_47164 [Suhomyces tanzawaensis NRRL Y-17324]ODV80854.1 hypothetical protein CANTADRAFT_47164 [Suhomyces tanzawaensis NRRL Y-17324]